MPCLCCWPQNELGLAFQETDDVEHPMMAMIDRSADGLRHHG